MCSEHPQTPSQRSPQSLEEATTSTLHQHGLGVSRTRGSRLGTGCLSPSFPSGPTLGSGTWRLPAHTALPLKKPVWSHSSSWVIQGNPRQTTPSCRLISAPAPPHADAGRGRGRVPAAGATAGAAVRARSPQPSPTTAAPEGTLQNRLLAVPGLCHRPPHSSACQAVVGCTRHLHHLIRATQPADAAGAVRSRVSDGETEASVTLQGGGCPVSKLCSGARTLTVLKAPRSREGLT